MPHTVGMDMKQTLKGVGVSLSPGMLSELDAYAATKGLSRSEAIRVAIAVGLPMLKLGLAVNTQRTLAILEHTQLALSLLVERQYPEDAGALVDMAFQNVEEYHA